MLEIKEKVCSLPECKNTFKQFNSLKKYCSPMCELKHKGPKERKQYKPIKRTPLKRSTKPIKKKTKKLSSEERIYEKVKAELRAELILAGKWTCFFTGEGLPANYNKFHHLKGRKGQYLTNKKYIVPALDEPHLNYHDLSVKKLKTFDWYEVFLSNLKKGFPDLYEKELLKKDK